MITTGSDFSGVGAFDQALIRLGVNYETVFACDMDKFARQTYVLNYGEPKYYPKDVYEREIPKESLDIYMTSPPCQAFSLAGKRKGETDKRGILFYNSHEFIQKNKPRYFIFENVKGLLSDDSGKTFQRWIDYLGGKSVNGNPVIFPHEESTPYHVYYQVMNAKHYGVPQNRERIFIIGIRDDEDNNFSFPKPFPLVKRLKDVLESEVDEKYFLSDKMMEGLIKSGDKSFINQDTQASKVFSENGEAPNICAGTHGYANGYVETKVGTWRTHEDGRGFRATEDNNCPTIPARAREDGSGQPVIKIGAIRGRNPVNSKSRISGLPTEQMLEINENGTSNALTTVQKDNVVILPPQVFQLNPSLESGGKQPYQQNRVYDIGGVSTTLCRDKSDILIIQTNNSKGYDIAEEEEDSINFSVPNSETRRGRIGKKVSQTLDTQCNQGIFTQQRIRRLTPKECFRLMDFDESFKWDVSDSQAYKQAGNSIVVSCLVEIIKKLNLNTKQL